MELPEPRPLQYRTAAWSLVFVATLGAYRVAATWAHTLTGLLTLPLLVAFLIFNIGYGWAGTKVRFQTKGAKLGALAVALNVATMVLPPISPVFWTAVSLCAVALALAGAAFLFKDASKPKSRLVPLFSEPKLAFLKRLLVLPAILTSMAFGVVIRWVDRQWEQYPNAVNWLGLMVAAAWLSLIVLEPHRIWIGAAVVWSAFWIIIFVWRWLAWLRRIDGKWRRRRNR